MRKTTDSEPQTGILGTRQQNVKNGHQGGKSCSHPGLAVGWLCDLGRAPSPHRVSVCSCVIWCCRRHLSRVNWAGERGVMYVQCRAQDLAQTAMTNEGDSDEHQGTLLPGRWLQPTLYICSHLGQILLFGAIAGERGKACHSCGCPAITWPIAGAGSPRWLQA